MRQYLLLCALPVLAACKPVDVEGDWSGGWQTTWTGFEGTLTITLVQADEDLTGDFDIGGTTCVGEGQVDGTVDGHDVSLVLRNGSGGEVHLDGDVSNDQDRIEGHFDVTGGFCSDASGSWELHRL
jgi:hypothetical protein